MHHAFDTLFQLDEGAVVGHADHAAAHHAANGVAIDGGFPRVVAFLFEPQADSFALGVEAEYFDFDLLAHLDHLRGVFHPAPTHVGHMQQPVDAADVHKRAEVGDVLDFAGDDLAGFDSGKEFLFFARPRLFEELAAADDDIAAALGELDDLKFHALADEFFEVARRAERQLAGGHERVDADVDLESPFDAAGDDAFDDAVSLVDQLDFFPILDSVRFNFGQDRHALIVFRVFDVKIELGPCFEGRRIVEFRARDHALALVADVYKDAVVVDFHDFARHDFAFFEILDGLVEETRHGCFGKLLLEFTLEIFGAAGTFLEKRGH